MQLAALNIDVLLHLLEFVDPIDRFNLILSGILKGFDNVSKGMDLRKRLNTIFCCSIYTYAEPSLSIQNRKF